MEARGFIFGSLAAQKLGISFVPLRKPNKLPYNVESLSYDLEYGSAALEIHVNYPIMLRASLMILNMVLLP